MTFALRIVQFLILLFVIRMIVTMVRTQMVARKPGPRARSLDRSQGMLVRDPHCGTYVPQDRAITSGRGSGAEYFCSVECRDAWVGDARRRA